MGRPAGLHEPDKMTVGLLAVVIAALLAALLPVGQGTVMVTVASDGTVLSDGTAGASSSGATGDTSSAAGQNSGGSATSRDGSTAGTAGLTAGSSAGTAGAGPRDNGSSSATPLALPTGTGSSGSNAGATYQGVTADSVFWGFSAQANGCGGFNQNETAAAFGVNANPAVAYEAAAEFFNTHVLDNFPLPPEIRAHVNPENGYWGRRITSVFRDSGGFACQDVGRANAVRMAEEDKVFGLVMRGNEGPEVPMSLVMAQHGLVHIGRHLTTRTFQQQREPYFFDGFWGSGEIQNIGLGSWICRDWKDQPAADTGDPLVSGMPRKFAITRPEGSNFDDAVAALAGELDACGVAYTEYSYPVDLSTVAANIETVVTRMKRDGITTLLTADPFLFILFMSQAADKQVYFPEWVRSGFSDGSRPAFYTTFMTATQARNAWAAADAASPVLPGYYESESYLAWKAVRPDEEPIGDWDSYYFQFKTLALGMAGAGPTLTPETFAEGLQRVCNPCPRSDPLLPLETYQPGKPLNLDGFTLVKWNPNKPCPICPPDAEGNQPVGYFDFLEDGKRYGRRISEPDPGR